jgi:hypothetical protein
MCDKSLKILISESLRYVTMPMARIFSQTISIESHISLDKIDTLPIILQSRTLKRSQSRIERERKE